jgi:hypothetical protein
LSTVGPRNAGLLVLDGVIARELALGDTVSSELLGEGDLLRPWTLDDDVRLVEAATGWNVVPLALSHRALGQLVGARRPTVSTALAKLARCDRVSRRSDGTWLLHPTSRPSVGTAADAAIRQRRHLLPAVDEPALERGEVWTAIEALYEKSRAQGEDVEILRREIAALHQRMRRGFSAGPRTRMRA